MTRGRRTSASSGSTGPVRIPGATARAATSSRSTRATLRRSAGGSSRPVPGGRLLDRRLHRAAGRPLRARGGDRLLASALELARPAPRRRSANVDLLRASLPRADAAGLVGRGRAARRSSTTSRRRLSSGRSAGSRPSSVTARACSRSAGAASGATSRCSGDDGPRPARPRALAAWHALDAPQRRLPARPLRRAMSTPERIVIVGAGPAGLATARAYREHGGTAEVTLLGAETLIALPAAAADQGVPARRAGRRRAADRVRRTGSQENDVELRLGCERHRDRPRRRNGDRRRDRTLAADAIVLATGAEPVRPGLPGLERPAGADDPRARRQRTHRRPSHGRAPARSCSAPASSAARSPPRWR